MKLYLLAIFCLVAIQPSLSNENLFFWKLKVEDKVIFLTFDDGPGEYTKEVLRILKSYNVKATFFVLGELVKIRKDIVKQIINDGHDIGSHTYSHQNFYQLQKKYKVNELKEILISELKKTEYELKSILGENFKIKLLRMPHGYYRKWMDEILNEFGYKVVNWTFGCDWFDYSEQKMLNMYISALEPGGVYLFHDGGKDRKKTINVLEKFIKYCLEQGYKFDLLRNRLK